VSGPPAQTEPPSRPSEIGIAISEQELEGFQHRSSIPSAQPSEASITHPSKQLGIRAVDELAGIGVDIHILDQNGGTLDTSNAMGRFFLTTIASLAELERGQISERTKFAMKHLKDNAKVFTGPVFGWDRDGEDLIPNWLEQDKIDYMRHRHYVQGWSVNRVAKHFNELGIKGKLGGSWTSSMILRTCRYTFHENRRLFKHPDWWSKEPYHDSVSW